MPSGGGGGTTNQTTTSTPWSGAQPYLTDIMSKAQGAYNNSANNQYYPGQTYAPESAATQQAMNMITQRATNGSPLVNQAQTSDQNISAGQGLLDPNSQAYLTAATQGKYLDPTQDPAWNTAMSDITNNVNSQFGAAGRTGSGANAMALGRGMTQGASGIYDNERGLQQQAAGLLQSNLSGANNQILQANQLAPSLASQDYANAAALTGVGQQQEAYTQQGITDAMNRYNYNQNLPWQNLNNYDSILSGFGGLGGTSTSTGGTSQNGGGLLGTLGGIASIAAPLMMFA